MSGVLLLLFVSVLAYKASAQGCSDAGACSFGAQALRNFGSDTLWAPKRHRIGVFQSYGVGEKSTPILTTTLEASFGIAERWQVQIGLPFSVVLGELATVAGTGNLRLAAVWEAVHTRSSHPHRLWASVGTILPTGNADRRGPNNQALPMFYQPTLGSVDLLAGVRWAWRGLSLGAVYQAVLTQNQNQFVLAQPLNSPGEEFFQSRELRRGNDIALQANYQVRLLKHDRLRITPGVLLIYHHKADEVLDFSGTRSEIPASVGATVNLNANVQYDLSAVWGLQVEAGAPVLVRDYRTDGLQRSLVVSAGVTWRFGEEKAAEPLIPVH